MNRPGPPGGRDPDRPGEVACQGGGGGCGPRGLGDGRGHVGLPDLLEAAATELPGGRVPGDEHHRRLGGERGEKRADRVGVTGAAGDQRNAGLAGETAPRIRHVDRSRLVAHVHEIEVRVESGIEDRHDVIAREGENPPAAEAGERAGNDVGASRRPGHGICFKVADTGSIPPTGPCEL